MGASHFPVAHDCFLELYKNIQAIFFPEWLLILCLDSSDIFFQVNKAQTYLPLFVYFPQTSLRGFLFMAHTWSPICLCEVLHTLVTLVFPWEASPDAIELTLDAFCQERSHRI